MYQVALVVRLQQTKHIHGELRSAPNACWDIVGSETFQRRNQLLTESVESYVCTVSLSLQRVEVHSHRGSKMLRSFGWGAVA
jgi:hypothetical protein